MNHSSKEEEQDRDIQSAFDNKDKATFQAPRVPLLLVLQKPIGLVNAEISLTFQISPAILPNF